MMVLSLFPGLGHCMNRLELAAITAGFWPSAEQDARHRAASEIAARNDLQRRRRDLESQLGARYSQERVQHYEVYCDEQGPALAQLKAYAENLSDNIRQGRNLVLLGSVGTGKDHLLAKLLYRCVDLGLSALRRNCQDLYRMMRDRMGADEREDQVIAELSRPNVLALSDPVTSGELRQYRLELLYSIVNRRTDWLRPTWLTMNADCRADAEAKLSSQVWDRLQDHAEVIECYWPSWRARK